jgi:hypothetical protein
VSHLTTSKNGIWKSCFYQRHRQLDKSFYDFPRSRSRSVSLIDPESTTPVQSASKPHISKFKYPALNNNPKTFDMDSELRHLIMHAGAWCDEIPQSAYNTFLQFSPASISFQLVETCWADTNISYPEPTARLDLSSESYKVEQTTQVALQSISARADYRMTSLIQELPRTLRWLKETAREAPWQGISELLGLRQR